MQPQVSFETIEGVEELPFQPSYLTLLLAVTSTLHTRSFMQNPVTAREHYRLFVIYHLPKLRLLDFKKVTPKVR